MTIKTDISELAFRFEYYMFNEERWDRNPNGEKHGYGKAKGFTIGKGKKLYWYITPSLSGFYYAYPTEEDGTLGWKRAIESNQEVTIHY